MTSAHTDSDNGGSRLPEAVKNLLAAGTTAAGVGVPDVAMRKQLAICAGEVAQSGDWDALDAALGTVSLTARGHVRNAVEYVVEHPVLQDTEGQSFNARLFVLPVSQLLAKNIAMRHLPLGAAVQQILADTLCPQGRGILVNQFWPAEALMSLSYTEVWELVKMAIETEGTSIAQPEGSAYLQADDDLVSGLHFLPFVALVPTSAGDELLSLNGEELAVRSLSAMDAVHDVVLGQLQRDHQEGIQLCMHLPQPFFFEPIVVDLAHESFVMAVALRGWSYQAADEGADLELRLRLDPTPGDVTVVVEAFLETGCIGRYDFPVDDGDTEMQSEVCAAVMELSRSHGAKVTLSQGLALPVDLEAQDPLTFLTVSPTVH